MCWRDEMVIWCSLGSIRILLCYTVLLFWDYTSKMLPYDALMRSALVAFRSTPRRQQGFSAYDLACPVRANKMCYIVSNVHVR